MPSAGDWLASSRLGVPEAVWSRPPPRLPTSLAGRGRGGEAHGLLAVLTPCPCDGMRKVVVSEQTCLPCCLPHFSVVA